MSARNRSANSAFAFVPALALLAPLAGTACSYDLKEVYEHALPDGGASGDGATSVLADAQSDNLPTSTHLIAAWGRYPSVDRECIECAETACAQANDDCRADKDCEAYTQCVGAAPNPQGQSDCRGRFASWVSAEKVRDRDLAGPYPPSAIWVIARK